MLVLALFGLSKLGSFILELCFDSNLLFVNNNLVVPFGSEVRRRIMSEIYTVLDEIKKASADSHISHHKILNYSYLLVYLL